jgi:molecular chaperone GrpE
LKKKGGNGHDAAPAEKDQSGSEAATGEAGLSPVDQEAGSGPASRADEVETLRRDRDDLREQLLRRRADFENYKKRMERDRSQAGFEAAASIFRELVTTVDNLERALQSGASPDALRTGVELTYRELLTFLESQGVIVHDPVGQPFDPQHHQALMHEIAPGVPAGTVVEAFRKGYSYKDRLLRPALVKVAKDPEDVDEADDGIH